MCRVLLDERKMRYLRERIVRVQWFLRRLVLQTQTTRSKDRRSPLPHPNHIVFSTMEQPNPAWHITDNFNQRITSGNVLSK